jgi:hypothetical protein
MVENKCSGRTRYAFRERETERWVCCFNSSTIAIGISLSTESRFATRANRDAPFGILATSDQR